jgi:D-cysteine desulfhydrase
MVHIWTSPVTISTLIPPKIHHAEPPRIALAQLPTPLVDAPHLARSLGVDRLLVKRDDLTGLEVSGNKIRKLEYVIADALAQGCDTLVTHGGYQSNHCRATAAAGARLGLRVRMFLRSPSDKPALDGNLLLDHLFGADISYHAPDDYNRDRKETVERIMNQERAAGRKPYFFPVGASVPLGCWGYVRCMHELSTQCDPKKKLDVFVPLSSSGTLAGCVLGKALFGLNEWRVVGVPVSDSLEFFRPDVRQLIDGAIEQFQLDATASDTPVELLAGYIGEGYAIPYPEAMETLKLVARTTGLLLDPTYTAKGMHGLVDSIRKGDVLRPGATPAFLHTGGAFGLMARRELF